MDRNTLIYTIVIGFGWFVYYMTTTYFEYNIVKTALEKGYIECPSATNSSITYWQKDCKSETKL